MQPDRFAGFHHVAFCTADMERTIAYWRDLLGLRIVYAFVDADQKQYAFRIGRHLMVFFFEWKAVAPVKPKRPGESVAGPFVFDHLSLRLATREELIHLQEQLVAAGFPATDLIDHGFLLSFYTHDPNGIALEFSWAVPGKEPDELPVFISDLSGAVFPQTLPVSGRWPEVAADIDEEPVIIDGREKPYFR